MIFFFIFICWQGFANAQACKQSTITALKKCAESSETQLCLNIKNSTDCQSLYKEIEKNGENKNDFEKKCAESEKSPTLDYNFIKVCGLGAFNMIFGTLGKAIGEAAGEISIQVEDSFERDKECNSSLENKKKLYVNANLGLPKALQHPLPPDELLNKKTCQDIYHFDIMQMGTFRINQMIQETQSRQYRKESLSSEQIEILNWNTKRQEELRTHFKNNIRDLIEFPEKIYSSAIEGIENAGIKIECYNTQKKTELICGWIAQSIGLGTSAYKTGRALFSSAGLRKEAADVLPTNKNLTKPSAAAASTKFDSFSVPEHIQQHIQKGHVLPTPTEKTLNEMTSAFNANFDKKKEISSKFWGNHNGKKVARGEAHPDLSIFRPNRRSTLFPKDVSPDEVIKATKTTKLEFTPVKDSLDLKEATFKYKDAEYKIIVCKSETCKSADNTIVHKDEVTSLYPKCGKGVVQSVSLKEARDLIDKASPNQKLQCLHYFKSVPCGAKEENLINVNAHDWPCN